MRKAGLLASTAILCLSSAAFPDAAAAQSETASPESPREPKEPATGDIVVNGARLRGSVVTDLQPIGTFDSAAIEATGAGNMGELLRALRAVTQSADGSEPIFLLNAQRVSGYSEIGTLPPEAIERVEVLPEPAALKFGYPPTRRVVNFITKRRFQQVQLRGVAGTTTRGGGGIAEANLGLTRLDERSRVTLSLERKHTDPLLHSQRHVFPDPDIRYDAIGNVTGLGGGEIDPALSAAAGEFVTVAPVPATPSDPGLAGFAAGANRPRLFDLGPWSSLSARNDSSKAETVLATGLGERLALSVSLSAEQVREERRSGPAPAVLTVPAANPFSPFSRDVLLHRYLVETDPLRQSQTTTSLKAGVMLRGVLAGWRWDLSGALDQQRISGRSERGLDLGAVREAIAAGADPFAPFDASLLSKRLVDSGHLLTRISGVKTVVGSPPIRLPAGNAILTLTAEAERATADSVARGPNPSELHIGRTRSEGALSFDVPLASRREGFLPFLGELSVNGSAALRHVGGFGSLHDYTYGLTWGAVERVQLVALVKHSAAAPGLQPLSTPVLRLSDIPVFDYASRRTEIVTLVQGGNPDLAAERRRVRSLSLNVKPLARSELRIGATYEASTIRDQTGTIYATTPAIEQVVPDLRLRDASGRLVSVTYQPTNFFRQRTHILNITVASSGTLGKAPPPPPPGSKGPPPRTNYYAGMGPSIRFLDRLQLRRGAPVFDLLDGATVSGAGTARVYGYAYGGIQYLGTGMSFNGWYSAPTHVRSASPASDYRFSSIFRLNVAFFVSVHHYLPKEEWTRRLQLRLDIDNVTDHRQRVRDGNGLLPYRFQPALMEPVGRTVKLSLRKLF